MILDSTTGTVLSQVKVKSALTELLSAYRSFHYRSSDTTLSPRTPLLGPGGGVMTLSSICSRETAGAKVTAGLAVKVGNCRGGLPILELIPSRSSPPC